MRPLSSNEKWLLLDNLPLHLSEVTPSLLSYARRTAAGGTVGGFVIPQLGVADWRRGFLVVLLIVVQLYVSRIDKLLIPYHSLSLEPSSPMTASNLLRLLTCIAVLLALTSAALASPPTPEENNLSMWEAALQDYRKAHKGVVFRHQNLGLEVFDSLPNLKEDAWKLAQEEGKVKGAMLIGVRGNQSTGSRAIWFSTLIHPDDYLGWEMGLADGVALAFWRLDQNGKKLLTIDVITNHDISWAMEDLDKVVQRF